MPRKLLFVFALPLLLLAACSSSAKSSSTASAPTAQPTTATTTNIIRATPVGGSGATGAPAANAAGGAPGAPGGGGTRMNGTVKALASDEVTLSDGSTFKMAANVRVIKSQPATDTDLKTGEFVAITAMRQTDNTLLASIVNIFPASLSNIPAGQRPLPEGNLMTNATISTVSGKTFAVTFPGGGANIALAPNVQIIKQIDATAADVKVGATVGASVTDGVAQSVTLQGS